MIGLRGSGPMPKGDMPELWPPIGIKVECVMSVAGPFQPNIVWQKYNPYSAMDRAA